MGRSRRPFGDDDYCDERRGCHMCALALFYGGWLVYLVKKKHDRAVGEEAAGKRGEGVLATKRRR